MSFDSWKTLVGVEEERTWAGNKYKFRIGKEQAEANPIFTELQSNTPIRSLVEHAAADEVIRAITFLSYHKINPTFDSNSGGSGANLFWFPLDEITDHRYDQLVSRISDENETEEKPKSPFEDDSDEPLLSDFPVMSTASKPVIEIAVSDGYAQKVARRPENERRRLLEDQLKEQKDEKVEEMEDWLDNEIGSNDVVDNFSAVADVMGRMPALLVLKLIKDERSRLEDIHDIFQRMSVDPDSLTHKGPDALLKKLNKLAEDLPVFEHPAIEAFCLDENGRDCEFHVTKHRGLKLEKSLSTCEFCGSQLFRVFRAGLENTAKDAWLMGLLPELVVARVLEDCNWVEEVIPHRMVQMETEDGVTSSVEIDVSVHTKDDHALFFEVTSQRDGALGRVNKKREKFEYNDIEYDGLIQVSLATNPEMFSFTDNVVAASSWMIPNLERPEFKEDLYSELGIQEADQLER